MKNSEQGFYLLEFMVVLTLSLIVTSIASLSIDKVKAIATKQEMNVLKQALTMYESIEDKLPTNLSKLDGYLVGGFETDSFGQDYGYDKGARELCSDLDDPLEPYCITF